MVGTLWIGVLILGRAVLWVECVYRGFCFGWSCVTFIICCYSSCSGGSVVVLISSLVMVTVSVGCGVVMVLCKSCTSTSGGIGPIGFI